MRGEYRTNSSGTTLGNIENEGLLPEYLDPIKRKLVEEVLKRITKID
jgi:hypothetical protein